jgi:hypothetical protein
MRNWCVPFYACGAFAAYACPSSSVVENDSIFRPVYRVKDRTGAHTDISFHLDADNKNTKRLANLEPGTTLVIDKLWL